MSVIMKCDVCRVNTSDDSVVYEFKLGSRQIGSHVCPVATIHFCEKCMTELASGYINNINPDNIEAWLSRERKRQGFVNPHDVDDEGQARREPTRRLKHYATVSELVAAYRAGDLTQDNKLLISSECWMPQGVESDEDYDEEDHANNIFNGSTTFEMLLSLLEHLGIPYDFRS